MTAEVELFQPRPPAMIAAQQAQLLASPDDIDSWAIIASDVIKLSRYICETEFVPKNYRGNEYATAAAILAGRELGLPPFTALRHVHLVEGSPSLSAEYKRARVLAAGHDLDILEISTTRCRVSGKRRNSGKPPLEILFTIEDAKRAGLIKSRGAWETRPRRMLFARASTEVCDFLFADVTNGLPTTELLEAGEADEFGGYAESPGQAAPVQPAEPKPAARTARRRQAEPKPDPTTAATAAPAAPTAASATPPAAPAATSPDLPPLPGEDDPAAVDEPPVKPGRGDKQRRLVGIIHQHFKRIGFDDAERDQRLAATATIANCDPITSTSDLNEAQLSVVADTLARCKDRDRLIALLAEGDKPDAAAGENQPDGSSDE